MTLGNRLRVARERLEKPQAYIADHFGITPQAVSGWERDDSIPELDKLPDLRRLLRVTFAWLIAGEGEPPHPGDPSVLFDDQLAAKWMAASGPKTTSPATKARRR